MKKYTFLNKLVLLLIVLSFASCEGLFIPDPIDPRLPRYTENGNNVAGALINNKTWSSVVKNDFYGYTNLPYITNFASNDSLILQFYGEISDTEVILEFHMKGLNIHSYDDLPLLNNKKIQLNGAHNTGVYIISHSYQSNYKAYSYDTGQIYFRHASMDDLSGMLILSGTFGFIAQDSVGIKTEIYYGRFDFKFRENQNFVEK